MKYIISFSLLILLLALIVFAGDIPILRKLFHIRDSQLIVNNNINFKEVLPFTIYQVTADDYSRSPYKQDTIRLYRSSAKNKVKVKLRNVYGKNNFFIENSKGDIYSLKCGFFRKYDYEKINYLINIFKEDNVIILDIESNLGVRKQFKLD